jgi:hypothetical protein
MFKCDQNIYVEEAASPNIAEYKLDLNDALSPHAGIPPCALTSYQIPRFVRTDVASWHLLFFF